MGAGSFRTLQPDEGLTKHFRTGWIYNAPATEVAVLPDGLVHLRWHNGDLTVAGPSDHARNESLSGGGTAVGFTFRPGAASCWLAVPISHIAGQRISFDELWGRDGRSLAGYVNQAHNAIDAARRLAAGLAQREAALRPAHADVDAMSALLERHSSVGDVPAQLSSLGFSARTLHRHCTEAFGYGPKTLERILRFQRFVNLARGSERRALAQWAAEAGYSDQAHLSREARRISGLSAGAIVRQLGR
jgi:methylphosphotriester-DNA--protein-cysteine methyltransferase